MQLCFRPQVTYWEGYFFSFIPLPMIFPSVCATPTPALKSVVFTRQGYRSLLYHIPEYVTFLRCLMASTTILYLGFSFTDAYLNEIRSEPTRILRTFICRTGS